MKSGPGSARNAHGKWFYGDLFKTISCSEQRTVNSTLENGLSDPANLTGHQ